VEHPAGDAAAGREPVRRGLSNPRWRPITEGWPVLGPLTLIGLAAVRVFPPAAPLALLATAAAALTFRDPERAVGCQSDVALAPADGRVIHIGRVWDPYWQAELVEIVIFLALWDVHVQRSPLDGEVVARHHQSGAYHPAMSRTATHGNNQVATYVRTVFGPCVVTQISGLLARRIVSWAAPGTWLTQGGRLGMIRFGSQVTLRLPAAASVLVVEGDRVRAGLTPVAKLAEGEAPAPGSPTT
jgi:phosphatidylserine decarboxylase